ncbi:MAG: gliding motility-associated C-terminal domain-containing protein, partial [Muribaculaceae bacterium]|nr:gliding motility-associated C-terminal domain-containing protein [Muribaculaceae bacterium]
TYTASSATSSVEWTRYSQMGGAYGENVQYNREGTECSITLSAEDMGYIITENGRNHCYWIVNYSNHTMILQSATVNNEESDCIMTAINVEGSAPRITYYTINGIPRELSRDIIVDYNTLIWNDESQCYLQHKTTKTLASIESTIRVESPLCDTDFEISGDRFLKEWGHELSAVTPGYNAVAIDIHTHAETTPRDNDNEISGDNSQLGGSAPVEITFTAATSDAVAFKEWQTSRSPEFDIIDLRFNQEEVSHTFREYGTTYVRFIAANASGDCDWTSETYQVSIGESRLECPNAFSPGASEGINDEWKVSFKSIVTFECHIFNQWGIELFSTTNPAQGWDGRYGNKLVPAGVYYYVIKARGADGKDYSLAGDINIINFKQGNNRPTNER